MAKKKQEIKGFGVALDAEMRAADVSPTELAQRMDIARTTVYRWLSGHRVPDRPTVALIANALGRPLEPLMRARHYAQDREKRVQDLAAFLNWLLSGEDIEVTLQREYGDTLDRLSPAIVEELRETATAARRATHKITGGLWHRMHPEDRLEVVGHFLDMALRERPTTETTFSVSLRHPLTPPEDE